MTYQQVASAPDLFAHHLARPTFVVLDEIHHAGESATWGTALRAAFDGAQRGSRCPARRSAPTRGRSRSSATTTSAAARRTSSTATREAVRDERLPPARVPAARRDAALARRRAGDDRGLRRRARPADDARRLRTAIDPRDAAAAADAPRRRRAARQGARRDPGRRRPRALRRPRARPRDRRAAAHDRRREAGRRGQRRAAAHARIDRFARAGRRAARWLVAVNMVSEGVDVPRLMLAAYATVKRTDLFFRQAVGRVVRRRAEDPDDLVATVFLPADPTLKGCAERVEVELRQQVSDEVGAAFDVEPPPGVGAPRGLPAARRPGRARRDDRRRRALRERRGRRRAPPAARARTVRARAALRARVRPARARRRSAPPPTPVPAHRRVEHKRRALDRLARRWAQLRREIDPDYTWPQAQARVNRAMGVARRADAGEAAARRRPGLPARRTRQARRDYPERPSGCGSRQRRGHRGAAGVWMSASRLTLQVRTAAKLPQIRTILRTGEPGRQVRAACCIDRSCSAACARPVVSPTS